MAYAADVGYAPRVGEVASSHAPIDTASRSYEGRLARRASHSDAIDSQRVLLDDVMQHAKLIAGACSPASSAAHRPVIWSRWRDVNFEAQRLHVQRGEAGAVLEPV